jgi:hypothetical protein
MIRAVALCAGLALAAPAGAQSVPVSAGSGATLRALDRLTGELQDIDIRIGDSVRFGRLVVSLVECRFPTANPSGDAYAFLLIDDTTSGTKVFEGWMFASSPALNALDHMRYDVWVLTCSRA